MPNLQGMRRRIRSVKNMRQITRAMKLVSASKLKRANDRVIAARPYANKLREMLFNLAQKTTDYRDPLLEQRGDQNILVVLITSDKGLCAAFNTNLLKRVTQFLREQEGKHVEFIAIGRKGRDYLRRRQLKIRNEYVGLVSKTVSYKDALEIAEEVLGLYRRGDGQIRWDKVYLIYNEFKTALQQNLILRQMLPLGAPESLAAEKASLATAEYKYEQPPAEILGRLLPHYVEMQVYQALLNSVASEHGARMAAMDSATKNASEVIDKLTLNMNRVRQAAITREIIEVVSGAAAL
jgi:F-type H+-transporting ATPase subunit gamma